MKNLAVLPPVQPLESCTNFLELIPIANSDITMMPVTAKVEMPFDFKRARETRDAVNPALPIEWTRAAFDRIDTGSCPRQEALAATGSRVAVNSRGRSANDVGFIRKPQFQQPELTGLVSIKQG
jgi:hypothetical protein